MRFICRAKELGFTLREIGELLAIADGEIVDCAEVRRVAEDKLLVIDEQVRNLTRLRRALRVTIEKCRRSTSMDGCPLIQALSKDDL